MYVCLLVCPCTMCVPHARRGQRGPQIDPNGIFKGYKLFLYLTCKIIFKKFNEIVDILVVVTGTIITRLWPLGKLLCASKPPVTASVWEN